MRQVVQFVSGSEGHPAWKLHRLLSLAGNTTRALRYCLAAQLDERKGFPFAAAMEWQKAADLFFPIAPFAELCWCKWERIVRLPRRFAEPIIDPLQHDAHTSQHFVPTPEHEIELLISISV